MYLNKNKNNIIALVQLFIVNDITFYSPFKGSPTLDLNYQNYQVFMIVCILPQESKDRLIHEIVLPIAAPFY